MQTVWEHSRATDTALLVMLAIADNANDAGVCWPAVETIAKKARCSDRTVQRLLKHLVEELRELVIEKKAGPHQCNRYRITLSTPTECHPDNLSPRQDVTSRGDTVSPRQLVTPTPEVLGGDIAVSRGGDIAVSPDPSGTVRNHHSGAVVTDCQGDNLSGCQDVTPDEVGSLVPSEEEVLEFARTYEDLARGFKSIPEGYALSWYSWRCEDRAGPFPRDWKGDLRRRYVASVLDKKTAPVRNPVESARSKRLEELRRIVNDPRSTPKERVVASAELEQLQGAVPA